MPLHWTRYVIKGCKYLPDLDIPGAIVLNFKGKNKEGKSLAMKLMHRILVKEHDPDLIRPGSKKLETLIELSDGMVIERTMTQTDSYASVRFGDGRILTSKVETFLKDLASGFNLDPFALIGCDSAARRKEREEYLRQIFPITFSTQDLAGILGRPMAVNDAITLAEFDQHLAAAEQARSEANARREVIEKTLQGLEDLPALEAKDWWTEAQNIQRQLNRAEASITDTRAAIYTTHRQRIADRKARLQLEIDAAISALSAAAGEDFDVFEKDAESAWEQERAVRQPAIDALNIELGAAQQNAKAQQQAAGLLNARDQQQAQLREAALDRTRKQQIVDDLRQHRADKLNTLPIPGLEYKDGHLFVDGKDFDKQMNTGAQIEMALQIASYGNSKLALVLTDRMESLDEDARAWAVEAIKAAGMQMVMTEVERGTPFTVEQVA
jgi:hypothetical protein